MTARSGSIGQTNPTVYMSDRGGKSGYLSGNISLNYITASLAVTSSTTYYLRGYYPAQSRFVYWSGTSKDFPNPDGYPLVDVTQDG